MTRGALGRVILFLAAVAVGAPPSAFGQDEQQEQLAKQLANPVASLISVPLQGNYDREIGPAEDGQRFTLNIQPVIPIGLAEDWNLISRTILPVIYQDDVFPGAGDQFGLGDTLQSLFLSPAQPMAGWIWGAGPVFLLPTATDDLLGSGKWGIGPTAVALQQTGPWTYGILVNHVWSIAGEDDRRDVSSTFLQPFLSYTTRTAWTFSLNTESTYDWKAERWSVPLNAVVSKVTRIGGQLVSFAVGARYWAESPDTGPHGWGARFVMTLLFPR